MSSTLGFDTSTNTFLNTQRATMNLTERSYENDLNQIDSSNTNGLLVASTNIYIKANGVNVGMIQSFSVQENRAVNKLQAIGQEGVCQAVPQNTKGGQITASRLALYGERLYDAFQIQNTSSASVGSTTGKNLFKTLKDQRIPFEIQVSTVAAGSSEGETSYYHETYVDCWISNYRKNYTVQNITVSEEVTIMYADVV